MNSTQRNTLRALADRLAGLLATGRPACMKFVSEEQFLAVVGLRREPARLPVRRSRRETS